MIKYVHAVVSRGLGRTAVLRFAYVLTGSVVGLLSTAPLATLLYFGVTLSVGVTLSDVASIVTWVLSILWIVIVFTIMGSRPRLRDLDRKVTNSMLGTAIVAQRTGGSPNTSAPSGLRRVLGLTPGFPAWRATLWFTFRGVFGALVLAVLSAIVLALLMALLVLLEVTDVTTFGGVVTIVSGTALIIVLGTISLLLGIACTHKLAELFSEAAADLLGPSAAERIAEYERELRQRDQQRRLNKLLHDYANRALTGIIRQASGARKCIHSKPEYVGQALIDIEEEARSAHDRIKELLASQPAESIRLLPPDRNALNEFLAMIHKQRLDITAEISDRFDALPGLLRDEVANTIKEGCYNALRYAASSSVCVIIDVGETEVEVNITNDAPESAAEDPGLSGSGLGLREVAERVRLLDGLFEAGPTREGGYRLHAVIPIPGIGSR